jgi:calcineurin-like phosphoesterase family protein
MALKHWHAVVHHSDVIWFSGDITGTLHCGSHSSKIKLVRLLLDNGIEVQGYWSDCDYTGIDPRISSEKGRRP